MITPRAYLLTLGCAKNEVDSNDMAKELLKDGYKLVDSLADADVALINTCSFIQAAAQESIDAILEISDVTREAGRKVPIIVCGCLPSRYGDDLERELTEAQAFVPCSREDSIVEIANKCIGRKSDKRAFAEALPDIDKCALEGGLSAYLKISDGCSRCCAYCTIPQIRGPYRSYSEETIIQRASELVSNGVKEIVLIAQDTGIWGRDFDESKTLASLLSKLSDLFPDTWLRVMYTQPDSITDELLDVIASRENICPYLDIPMQHCQEHILNNMGRRGDKESMLSLVEKIRMRIPDVAIRTTLMVGFPNESDEDFGSLVSFVEQARFDYVGVFAYSREEGTRAFDLDGQIDEEEKQWRAERLRTIADATSSSVICERIGSTYRMLIEGVEEDGQPFGRVMQQAFEVDGVTYIDSGIPSSFESVIIEDTLMYDMEAGSSV